MGDRANVKLSSRGHVIYLYTHWQGSGWPEKLHKAFSEAKERWNDPAYCQRYLVTSMMPHKAGELTGYGVSGGIEDNQHPIFEVDFDHRQVRRVECRYDQIAWKEGAVEMSWTFEEFCQANPKTLYRAKPIEFAA